MEGIVERKEEKGSHIRWDEETISKHDKDRGTRMKIDEAKTPYRSQSPGNYKELSEDGKEKQISLEWEEFHAKLTSLEIAQDANHASDEKKEKSAHFSEKRKRHYNEYQMAQAWKQSPA